MFGRDQQHVRDHVLYRSRRRRRPAGPRVSSGHFFKRNVTKFSPHTALKLIACGKLTFDERVVVHRLGRSRALPLSVGVLQVERERSRDIESESERVRERVSLLSERVRLALALSIPD